MNKELEQLHHQLVQLHHAFRDKTQAEYTRINPFYEDLFSWKERGEYRFGSGKNITLFNTCTVLGDVEVGDNTWVGPFSSLDGSGKLRIGRFCCISAACHIMTHDTARYFLSGGKAPHEKEPVTIGDCCYLGVGVIVTKGVTIGSGSVIGAGAVVTNDIPANSIAVGVPARVVGTVKVKGDKVEYHYFEEGSSKPLRKVK